MPLHITKWERRDGADRDAFANAALTMSRFARSNEGVRNSRFYWADIDTIAILVDAEPGAWGPDRPATQRQRVPRRSLGCRIWPTRAAKRPGAKPARGKRPSA